MYESPFLLSCLLFLITGTDSRPDFQLHFPIEDVVKNAKQFVLNVKRATGNLKDAIAEAEAKAQKGKNSKSVKPGAYLVCASFFVDTFFPPFLHPGFLALSPPRVHPYPSCPVLRYNFSDSTLLFERIFPPLFSFPFFFLINRSTVPNFPFHSRLLPFCP